MNDKEYATQKKRVERVIDKWVKPLGLRWWKLGYKFYREPLPPYEGESIVYSAQAVMDCHVSWKYLRAWIRFNLIAVADLGDVELEWAFVHECAHVFLNEMREEGIDHEERVASHLADAFIWLREHVEGEKKRPAPREKE